MQPYDDYIKEIKIRIQNALERLSPTEEHERSTIFARWHCILNSWDWPEDWGERPQWMPDRDGWLHEYWNDDLGRNLLDPIIKYVKSHTTLKECLRVWNVEILSSHERFFESMTNEDFESVWDNVAESIVHNFDYNQNFRSELMACFSNRGRLSRNFSHRLRYNQRVTNIGKSKCFSTRSISASGFEDSFTNSWFESRS
jgi:hypothetical protein